MLQAAERKRILDALESMDESCPQSIESVGKLLEGLTFNDILSLNRFPTDTEKPKNFFEEDRYFGQGKGKGNLGQLIEERFFGYYRNSETEPDFPAAGVELKSTPYKMLKSGKPSAKERVVICMISYREPIARTLEDSSLWKKMEKILLVFYEHEDELRDNRLKQGIRNVWIHTPTEKDLEIIRQDYEDISTMVRNGLAHMLREGDTLYLGACTKGSTLEKSWKLQYYPSLDGKKKARSRAFAFKSSYMKAVLKSHLDDIEYKPIVSDISILRDNGLDNSIRDLFVPFIGMTDRDICLYFGIKHTRNKSHWRSITNLILGVDQNEAEELKKQGASSRTICLEHDGRLAEDLPLLTFEFMDLVAEESWEASELREYLNSLRLMLVIFQKDEPDKNGLEVDRVLREVIFWKPPAEIVEREGKKLWAATRRVINDGVETNLKMQKNGVKVEHNLPKARDFKFVFVRNRAKYRYVEVDGFEDTVRGKRFGSVLPDGRWLPKPAFWLSGKYLASDIDLNGD
ncbi:MAG: hypothetical protein FWE46_01225 [Coriobacteriia bacterium]|nr:hypothetical protein [Coriobacteriia bacterium]MCL2536665.1 hypothetical protein [Coriobacteriia bacterium]